MGARVIRATVAAALLLILLAPAARGAGARSGPVSPTFHGIAVQRPLDDEDIRMVAQEILRLSRRTKSQKILT